MQNYNRALDRVALAMVEGKKGNYTLAAKLFASALKESDVRAAIATLEASNAHAFRQKQVRSSRSSRLRAKEEMMMEDDDHMMEDDDHMMESSEDPLDEVEHEEDEPEEEMVQATMRMFRGSRRI